MTTTWRERLAPLISEIIIREGTADMRKLRKALREAFPCGERKYHPYRIWLDEINVQLGIKKMRTLKKARQTLINAGQTEMEI